MKCFITGLSSVSGQCLAQMLVSEVQGIDVAGCGTRHMKSPNFSGRYSTCDVSDRSDLAGLLESQRPEYIYHLAGSADSSDTGRMMRTNVVGTANLLQICRDIGLRDTKILLVGSAAGFGEMTDDEESLSETRQPRPESFYGMSREAAFELGRIACKQWGMSVYFCRPFNLIGPGLGEHYVAAALIRKLMDAGASGRSSISIRNLSAIRDFVDIRDAVKAYHAILARGTADVPYSIGRGIGVTIQELAEELAAALSIEISIISDENPADNAGRSAIMRSVAATDKLRMETEWSPGISLRQSVRDMVARWVKSSQIECEN